MYVGERIRKFRKAGKFNQKILAKNIGVNLRTVQRYEKGETAPGAEVLQKIASFLNIEDLGWLLTGAEAGEGSPSLSKKGAQIAERKEGCKSKRGDKKMEDLLLMARMVLLKKESRHSCSLEENIRSLYQAVSDEEKAKKFDVLDKGLLAERSKKINPQKREAEGVG